MLYMYIYIYIYIHTLYIYIYIIAIVFALIHHNLIYIISFIYTECLCIEFILHRPSTHSHSCECKIWLLVRRNPKLDW